MAGALGRTNIGVHAQGNTHTPDNPNSPTHKKAFQCPLGTQAVLLPILILLILKE